MPLANISNNLCYACNKKPPALLCYYCPLVLFCSATCANKTPHPCQLARYLFHGHSVPSSWWLEFSDQLRCLEQLYSQGVSLPCCEILIAHGVCSSENALLALLNHCHDFFVWPHEKKKNRLQLECLALSVSRQQACTLSSQIIATWALHTVLYIPVLKHFMYWPDNADLLLNALKRLQLGPFIFTLKKSPFLFLCKIVSLASTPFLYTFFHNLLTLQATIENAPFLFFSAEGRSILIPPLFSRTWKRANDTDLPSKYSFTTQKQVWAIARLQYFYFEKRKTALLELMAQRNPHFLPYLNVAVVFQKWPF